MNGSTFNYLQVKKCYDCKGHDLRLKIQNDLKILKELEDNEKWNAKKSQEVLN